MPTIAGCENDCIDIVAVKDFFVESVRFAFVIFASHIDRGLCAFSAFFPTVAHGDKPNVFLLDKDGHQSGHETPARANGGNPNTVGRSSGTFSAKSK